MNIDNDHIEWTPKRLERLKVAYNNAVSSGKDQFVFEGYELITAYAKYLIEYLSEQFKQ